MMDLAEVAKILNFHSDASAKETFGMEAIFNEKWLFAQWEPGFIKTNKPSIKYLELRGVAAAILTWGHLIKNQSIVIFCDNQAVVEMINKMVSSCKNHMYLIRLIIFDNLVNNRRAFARYIQSSKNDLADSLSRLQFKRFWRLVTEKNLMVDTHPSTISLLVWPVSVIWQSP